MSAETDESCIFGRCTLMCPKEELKMRQKNDLIHILETEKTFDKSGYMKGRRNIANPKLAVKCFQRSAAGKDLCNPNILRPPDVLLMTVNHLLTSVILDDRLPWHEVYNFICDRLRAVRQDIIIQRLSPEATIIILKPMVRFHIYAEYRLFDVPISQFDPKLNHDQTMDCLKQILSLYDNVNCEYDENRWEMEAIYQIVNLGNTDALHRGLALPENIMNEELMTSLKLSLAWYCKYYVVTLRNFKTLSLILQMVFTLKLGEIRRYTLQAMSVAYSSRNSSYPLDKLANLLIYDSVLTLKEDCMYYNISIEGDHSVRFLKNSFDSSKQDRKRKVKVICDALSSISLPHLLLNRSNED